MGSLASELAPLAEEMTPEPRVYADANLPAGVVRFMRERLRWDVFFVIEDDAMRRARDIEHFRLARQMHRTLVTLDQDFLDDLRFPPSECGGILVLSAPHQEQFERLLKHAARALFQQGPLPLAGRKLHVHADWQGELEPET
jgi:predicted nuclease of predicted toxin-antitoxin system